jgi:hypothetical protein
MCSEQDLVTAMRERPVDRPGICHCSVPESVQIVLRRVQILSFDDFTEVGSGGGNMSLVNSRFRRDALAA